MRAPSIGVTAGSADHVAREITRRLYPLQAQAARQVAELTAKQQAEAQGRGAVADTLAGQLPGARVSKEQRRTRVVWRRESRPSGEPATSRWRTCARSSAPLAAGYRWRRPAVPAP
ncbi:hypothetical protein ACWDA7_43005 [Streptomyces sp. NPDC001156]